MSLKLKLFDQNIISKLREKSILRRNQMCNYCMYIRSEFSQVRLTHDNFDNHYYLDPTVITKSDCYGLIDQGTRSRRR